jgi:DNA repair protein RecO (recombination protein O)
MPGLYKDEGVVLKTIKLGEADRIVTIFTRYNGKVRAVAKGVRKTKSRFGARLEPFTQVQLLIHRGRRDLDTITGADILVPFKEVRTDFERVTAAAAVSELVEKIMPERERALSVYDLLVGALESVARGAENVVPAFLVKLLSVAGFHPQLSVCAGCGDASGLEGFSPALGGVVCVTCWDEDDGAWRIGSDRVALLGTLLTSEFGFVSDPAAAREVTDALRRYAEYHLERPLKSLQLLSI